MFPSLARPLSSVMSKKLHQNACRTCSTIIFPHSTNQIIDLQRHFLNSLLLLKRTSTSLKLSNNLVTNKFIWLPLLANFYFAGLHIKNYLHMIYATHFDYLCYSSVGLVVHFCCFVALSCYVICK